jgi:hypothetical protein
MMGYCYEEERHRVFTEDGQVMFLSIRNKVNTLTKEAGACTIEAAIRGQCGESWQMLACVDRLAELGEIVLIENRLGASQHNIIFRTRK